jgi:hypothetical protein
MKNTNGRGCVKTQIPSISREQCSQRAAECSSGQNMISLRGIWKNTVPQLAFLGRAFTQPRPKAAFQRPSRMLQRCPSLRPFAHGAAFSLAETSVSGQSCCSFVLVVPITSACASHQTWTNQTQLKAQLPLMPLRQLVFFLHPSALALSRILAAG